MLKVAKENILNRLNSYCKDALHKASELCISQGNHEVTVDHLIHTMIDQPGNDVSRIFSNKAVDDNLVKQKVAKAFDYMKKDSQTLPTFSPLLLELLQDAWLLIATELEGEEIRTGAIIIAIGLGADRYCHFFYVSEIEALNVEQIKNHFNQFTAGSMEGPIDQREMADSSVKDGQANTIDEDSSLAKYGRCLTKLASEGKIDAVYCRDQEISQITDILCRRRKNNPILVGEPGVGKTAVVEGLALKIYINDVPDSIKGCILWELDMGAMQAGASVKGEFERRLKEVLHEVTTSTDKILLFIDEAHTLIGGGGAQGGGDAANLLKPALARGELRTIAATTWSEYKKYFEKDPALTRRFQLIKIDEPSVAKSAEIVRGLVPSYEKAHGVYITDEAVIAAAELSFRYISGRYLPDKAFDVIDTACVRVASALSTKPRELDYLERNLALRRNELDMKSRDNQLAGGEQLDDFVPEIKKDIKEKMVEVETLTIKWKDEKHIVDQILDLRGQLHEQLEMERNKAVPDELEESNTAPVKLVIEEKVDVEQQEKVAEFDGVNSDPGDFGFEDFGETIATENGPQQNAKSDAIRSQIVELKTQFDELVENAPLLAYEVDSAAIKSVIADWTQIPISSMTEDDAERIIGLGEKLKSVVLGQDAALNQIHNRLKSSRMDLTRENTPVGMFLLVGPSGVGKTETALQVAESLFGGKQFLTTINMSEYQEKHTVSRLIGSPPGYVGYGEGGLLTEAIRKSPYSVVLLDEVEKAHPDVMNLFYQAFDKGEMADGEGRLINCKNIVFFMTSNLGSEIISECVENSTLEEMEAKVKPALLQNFKPALLARMNIICYKNLSDPVLYKIISHKLSTLAKRLKDLHRIELNWDNEVEQAISSLCEYKDNGARMIDQIIDKWILPSISDELIVRMASRKRMKTINITLNESKDEFCFGFVDSIKKEEEMEPA